MPSAPGSKRQIPMANILTSWWRSETSPVVADGESCQFIPSAAADSQSASGKTNVQIAPQLGLTNATVGKWRRRFLEQDVSGLYDELRPGRPRPISDHRVAQLVRKTLETKPKGGTHGSIRQIAQQTRLSKSTVHRIWQAFGLQPHRQKHFKLSTDPFFVEKVRDIVGLYLHPPENAVVLCVDEKSQIQALERTQPMLPMGLG
jgi:putative transposase